MLKPEVHSASEEIRALGPKSSALLNHKSIAAKLLNRIYLRDGYAPGPAFPGDSIRRGFEKLEKLGMIDNENKITPVGIAWLSTHNLTIED